MEAKYDSLLGEVRESDEIVLPETITVYHNVSASAWAASSKYTDYPYECAMAVSGITADSEIDVIFDEPEAVSGNYAPMSFAGNGTVTIYSKVDTAITIPKIRKYGAA